MPTNEGFVDWIATTVLGAEFTLAGAVRLAAQCTNTDPRDWLDAKPHQGYKQAARGAQGAMVMVGRPDMGCHLIIPGSALAGLCTDGLSVATLLKNVDAHGARTARLDLAIDALDSALDIPALKTAFDAGASETMSRKCSLILSGTDGYCLYIGSRTSDRFLRIYNKAAEIKARGIAPQGNDWIRVELELKGFFAHSAVERIILDRAVARTASAYVSAFIHFAFDARWTAMLGSVREALPRSSRKLTNTRAWLLQVCAAALARQLRAEPEFTDEFTRAVQSALAILDKPPTET